MNENDSKNNDDDTIQTNNNNKNNDSISLPQDDKTKMINGTEKDDNDDDIIEVFDVDASSSISSLDNKKSKYIRIGYNNNRNNLKWDEKYVTLIEYMNETRMEYMMFFKNDDNCHKNIPPWIWDGNVPNKYVTNDGIRLGVWICNQRVKKLQGTLHPEREEGLTNLGFKWKCRNCIIHNNNDFAIMEKQV